MSHIKGQRDDILHHPTGEHRTTSASTSGLAVSEHERRLRNHLKKHEEQDAEPPYPHAHASHERWLARREAADRVLAFLEAWEGRRGVTDTVYALGIPGRENPLTLDIADLRTLAESV